MQDHRKLRAYRQAHSLAVEIQRASRAFPRAGFGSLKAQLVKAAESTVFNIAEGCGSTSQREFARFLEISIKSSVEVESQLELAKDYGALGEMAWSGLTHDNISLRKMLCALRLKVLESAAQASNAPTRVSRVATAPPTPARTKT